MFKQRFLTAILLIPLVFCGIYYANDPVLVGIIALLGVALAWEWSALIPLSMVMWKALFLGALVLGIWPLYAFLMPSLVLNIGLWLGILWAVVTYPKTRPIWGHAWLMALVAWFSLNLFAHCLWALFHHEQGRWLLVYLLGLVWATDIGAYMFGKLWGKHRLIPQVSPGKTLEGSAGGIVVASAVAALGAWYFQPPNLSAWFVQAWIVIGFAMLGDLWISMLKRRVQLKDTGHILPGHGGVLDRLDSLVASLPIFYYLTLSYS
ncbi:MAG: phosphatidate cytidylyltransferase [Gammaproteobacteria bacterium]|nr:phosphatidate cytidylyltransferase [Gammaproteobacteria bacterium]